MLRINRHLSKLFLIDSFPLCKQADNENGNWFDRTGSRLGIWDKKSIRDEIASQRDMREIGSLALLGGVALTLPFMLRALSSRAQTYEERKRHKLLRDAAAMAHPVVSVDPDLRDTEKERKLNRLGLHKGGAEPAPGSDTLSIPSGSATTDISSWQGWPNLSKFLIREPLSTVKKLFGIGDKTRSDLYPTLATIMLAVGLGSGAYLSGKAYAKNREKRLEKRLDTARNRLDAMQYRVLAAGAGRLPKKSGLGKLISQTLPLLLASLGYAGWKVGRHFGSQANPQRMAYTELKRELESRTKRNDAPASLMFSPEMKELFGTKRPDSEESRNLESRSFGSASLI